MDEENPNALTKVHFFGGHADGAEHDFHMPPHTHDVPTKAGARHIKGKPFTRYIHSEVWTAALGKWTMIPEGYPGKPPREKAAA